MSGDDALRPRPGEPLGLWTGPDGGLEHHPEVRALRFEFSSGGDRVPGRLLLPPRAERPVPVVLLQHGAGGSKRAPYIEAAAGPWAMRGLAVASIDFPLHGERSDAKLSKLLTGGAAALGDLWLDVHRRAVIDLARAVDAVAGLSEIDGERVGYAGFSLGSIIGTAFCAVDPRPRAAAFALGGGGVGPAALDPTRYVARIAPRPVLFVNAEGDTTIPRAAAEALHNAAGEPKQVRWFDGTHTALPGVALKAMWEFLGTHLGADDAPPVTPSAGG
jgi:dienelactone hydrolase